MQLPFSRVAALAASLAIAGLACKVPAQTYPPAWKSTASYAIGDQVQLGGNVLRAIHAVSPGGFKYDEWELWQVRANTVVFIGVGQTFPSIASAWAYIQNATVAGGAYLHLYVDTAKGVFSESFNTSFSLDHPFGENISLIGDNTNNVTLTFPNVPGGFTIDTGHSFANLSGLSVVCKGSNGLLADGNSSIAIEGSISFTGCQYGIEAMNGAYIFCGNQTSISDVTLGLALARGRGHIFFEGINATATGPGQEGFVCDNGTIDATSSTLNGFSTGVTCSSNGEVNVSGDVIENCIYGVEANDRGFVNAGSCDFLNNTSEDARVYNSGTIDAAGSNVTKISNDGNSSSYVFH